MPPATVATIVTTDGKSGTGSTTHNLVGVPAGALLVLTRQAETSNQNGTVTSTPTLTWIKKVDAQATNSGDAEIYTATFTAGGSINIISTLSTFKQSSVCYVIINAEPVLAGATFLNNSQTAPTAVITSTRTNSLIIGVTSDWQAVNGDSRIYRNAITETNYFFSTNATTGYHYYFPAATITSYTTGVSFPSTQSSGTCLLEIRTLIAVGLDITPPTAPIVTAGTVTSSTIPLTWTAATDDVGVAAYEVYVNSVLRTTTTNLSYIVSGLTASTQYTIHVRAKDAAGNGTDSADITPTTSAPTGTRQNLIAELTFEGGNPFGSPATLQFNQTCCSYSLTQSQDQARAGIASAKFDLRKTDPTVSASKRSEFQLVNGLNDSPTEGERWYAGSWFLTAPWAQDGFGESLIQWHDNDITSPPFAILVFNGNIYGTVNINHTEVDHSMGPIAPYVGAWMDIVLHIKWTLGNTGFIECWLNGVKKMGSGTSINTTNMRTSSNQGQYMKIGMNKFIWQDNPGSSTTTQRIFYVDEFRVGNELATYQDVAPSGTPASGTTTTAPAPAFTTVSTFQSIGIYWAGSGGSASVVCNVRYKPTSTSVWKNGYPLWFDSRGIGGRPVNEYRGSIVGLDPGTNYDIELSLQGTATIKTGTAATWSEVFPEGATTTLNAPTTISTSGTPSAYRIYNGSINGGAANLTINASYIIIRNMTLTNATVDAIRIGANSHDIIIEGCDISGWGTILGDGYGQAGDAGIRINNASGTNRIIIQRNKIHHPHTNTNSWDVTRSIYGTNHPLGPLGINFENGGSNHVIRYNEIYSDATHYFMDGIGGAENFSFAGFPNANSDIYGNMISQCWDDGIESEGANMNVRVYGNFIDQTFVKVGGASTSIGPFYVFRNVAGESRRTSSNAPIDRDNEDRGGFLKAGSSDASFRGGITYVFNNTCQQATAPGYTYSLGCGYGIEDAGSGSMYPMFSRNNIFLIHKDWWNSIEQDFAQTGTNNYDYDLYNGLVPSGESHGIHGTIATSVVDKGTPLNNFTDGFLGTAPDMGAQESGAPSLEFGITAYL